MGSKVVPTPKRAEVTNGSARKAPASQEVRVLRFLIHASWLIGKFKHIIRKRK